MANESSDAFVFFGAPATSPISNFPVAARLDSRRGIQRSYHRRRQGRLDAGPAQERAKDSLEQHGGLEQAPLRSSPVSCTMSMRLQ